MCEFLVRTGTDLHGSGSEPTDEHGMAIGTMTSYWMIAIDTNTTWHRILAIGTMTLYRMIAINTITIWYCMIAIDTITLRYI